MMFKIVCQISYQQNKNDYVGKHSHLNATDPPHEIGGRIKND